MWCHYFAARRDVYLQFKALNLSKSGFLSLDEFYALYDIANLKWTVAHCWNRNHIKYFTIEIIVVVCYLKTSNCIRGWCISSQCPQNCIALHDGGQSRGCPMFCGTWEHQQQWRHLNSEKDINSHWCLTIQIVFKLLFAIV